MNTDKDDVRNILLADVPWTDQRDVILAMLSAAHAKGRAEGLREALAEAQRELATLRQEKESFYMDYRIKTDEQLKAAHVEIETLRPAAEALRVAVEFRMLVDVEDTFIDVISRFDKQEFHNGDPLAATIRAINRAAEAVKEMRNE